MSLVNKSLSIFNREIVFTFLRLGTGAIVARKLGPTGMGIWAALDLIVNYSRVFGAPRLEIATVYFWSQKQWNRGEILFTVNVVGFTMGLLLCFLLSFQHDLLRTFFVKTNIEPLLMILVFAHLPLRFVKRNYHYFLLAQEDTQSYNRVLVIDDVLKAMITITLLLFFDLGLWSLAIAIHISSACAFVYAAVKVRRTQRMVVHHNVKLFFTMLRFSMKVYVSEASGFLTIYISNLITALFLGPAQLAFFSMGKGKAEWLNRITNAIATVLYPRVSHLQGSGQDASITTTDASRISLLILSVAAFFLSLFIYPATLLLYGREFSPLVIVFFLILPGFIFHSVTSLQRQYFLGIGRAEFFSQHAYKRRYSNPTRDENHRTTRVRMQNK